MLQLFTIAILAYCLLMFLLPKGNICHELLHLPPFWIRMWRAPIPDKRPEYHPYGDHLRQYFLLFKSEADREPGKALVIFFHGGGWRFGAPEAFQANARVFLEAGHPVVLPSVRRIPHYHFDHMEQDLITFLQHLERLMHNNGWNGRPLVIGGMSSGGHLAAHLIFNKEIMGSSGFRTPSLAGAFFFGAPLDLDPLSWSPVIRLMAGSPQQERFRRANPIWHLPPHREVPVLVIHGTRDGLVPIASAESFVKELGIVQSVSVQRQILPGATHLKVASWGHTDNELRRVLLDWLTIVGQ